MNKQIVYSAVMIAVGVLFLAVLIWPIMTGDFSADLAQQNTNTVELGKLMFDNYGLALIGVGIVLFVSMLGGVYLAKEEDDDE
ncbi:hypothetical protein [Candidatus Methanomassiliicoccus intestinalis]|uniref:hypothetical protein n=1 Tax=Candidatus Methanomassiliicoccus intestinalis TaxID=1406512 RepID=UPI0037DD0563